MNIDIALRKQLETIFAPLNRVGAERAFPPPASLSSALEKLIPAKGVTDVYVKPQIALLFGTGAVEVWLRAVHSYLISAALTDTSPIWASASGYYSSHYSVRALAHLLGHVQLYRRKRVVRLNLHNGRYICSFDPKQRTDREHRLYWKLVKRDSHFVSDPLFTENEPALDTGACDVGHRDVANYADHLYQYPNFHALDENALKARVYQISQIEFDVPPVPNPGKFPDVESVQVIAYHRIVKFRTFLDDVLGGGNRFWKVHRNPRWASGMINFQLTEQNRIVSINN